MDQSGKVALKINPKLGISARSDFSEGLAAVKQGDLWGYIDTKGNLVIKPQFVRAEYFFDGMARVRKPVAGSVIGGNWGYIDKTGKLVYETKFKEASDFSDGMALVFYENKYAYLTPTGKIAFEINKSRYLRLNSYSEGLALICGEQGCGFMDKTGKVIIKPRKEIIRDFHDGRAMFWVSQKDNILRHKYGFIDKTGKVVIEPVWDGAKDFSGGVAIVNPESDGPAVIDISGNVLIDFKKANIAGFLDIGSFHEGLGRLKIESTEGKVLYGFIDKTGTVVIKPQFRKVEQFNSGLAFVQSENEIAYIDKTGNIIWQYKF
jgi:hypothetical protein